jgi:LDH2 family malate/lactate/ureidoglycolate dehydrogenase
MDSPVHLHVFIAGDPKECHGHGISRVKGIQASLHESQATLMQGHNQGTNAKWLQQEEKHPAWASECLQGPFHDHSKIEIL